MKDGWESLDEFFGCLNDNVRYVVLRNFESLDKDILLLEHPDIDILCSDRAIFLSVSRSFSRGHPNDVVHRFIVVNQKKIDIDIRCVGDGYYDQRWEEDILKGRKFYKCKFYVPSDSDYFYSLLYHVLIQKYKISDDYVQKLVGLAYVINITVKEIVSLSTLESFMKEKRYCYTYPNNPYTIANFEKVNKLLIKRDLRRQLVRKIIDIRKNVKKIVKDNFYGRKNKGY